jgi:hypothetical protein
MQYTSSFILVVELITSNSWSTSSVCNVSLLKDSRFIILSFERCGCSIPQVSLNAFSKFSFSHKKLLSPALGKIEDSVLDGKFCLFSSHGSMAEDISLLLAISSEH